MTLEEKLIVTAYTGVLMTEWSEFHKYAEELLDRPIWSHEFASKELAEQIKEKVKDKFLKLCE